eukprot:gb/GFBE01070013.1/.p1 GENE.gb/GFBE01070013.1/~~gb/GFBE01070013.1/.p1  ORF type:complete len:116 (+),score=24.28 gb/GFBE01070013.1/:1-348(+)
MARSRSMLLAVATLVLAAVMLGVPSAFVPPARTSAAVGDHIAMQTASAAAVTAALSMAEPAMAIRGGDDDEGFDVRIIAVLALPLLAIGWALFNVWRVAFRQVVRIGESTKGNAK